MSINLKKASLHPPALDAGDDEEGEEIPSVLLEYKAYVADRRNDTTAVTYSRCGSEIVQATFFAARPPRVSHLCVFCRPAAAEDSSEESQVLATDDNLVLLRIVVVSPENDDLIDGDGLYVYRPAGGDGPSLTLLPPAAIVFTSYQVGILSRPAANYMVAALCDCDDNSSLGRGRFILHLYTSELQAWTAAHLSVDGHHFQKYQEEEGYFLHQHTRAIAVGGDDATMAFVDLWRGLLLCDLSRVMDDRPWLRYVPLPAPTSGSPMYGDARISRDIAVVNGDFRFVRHRLQWRDCPTCGRDLCLEVGWKATVWTRPVSACSLMDDSWQRACDMDSSDMDVKSCSSKGCFQLLPKLGDGNDNNVVPFYRLDVSCPTLSWNSTSNGDDNTIWFMVKINSGDAKAWVVAVDIVNNRLQGAAEFDAQRYTITGFA